MVIEYTATPQDVVALYSYTRKHSFKHALIFYGLPIGLAIVVLVERLSPAHSLTVADWSTALIWGWVFFLGFPVILKLRTKKDKRTLSNQPDRVSTRIGTLKGDVPWKKVDSLHITDEHIFLMGKNMNGFAIPRRAFVDDKRREEFIRLCKQYIQASTTRQSK